MSQSAHWSVEDCGRQLASGHGSRVLRATVMEDGSGDAETSVQVTVSWSVRYGGWLASSES